MTARIRLIVLAFVVAYSVAFGPGQAFGGLEREPLALLVEAAARSSR